MDSYYYDVLEDVKLENVKSIKEIKYRRGIPRVNANDGGTIYEQVRNKILGRKNENQLFWERYKD